MAEAYRLKERVEARLSRSNPSRIRRTSDLPHLASSERRRRYPNLLTFEQQGFHLAYRLSRPRNFDYRDGRIKVRELFGWIIKSDDKVGAIHFKEYVVHDCWDNDEFVDLLDIHEEYEARLSIALCSAWEDLVSEVAAYGSILDFRSAWIAPVASRPDMLGLVGNAVIDRIFRQHAILTMNAFPLEYEGRRDRFDEDSFLRRQQAMYRYYKRCFGAELLPGWGGEDGWLWRAKPSIARSIPAPRRGEAAPSYLRR